MLQWWDDLTFLHFRYPVEDVQASVPDGLEVETADGSAWVSLVPFFLRVGLPGVRPIPWVSRFAEINVRTYVRSADGVSGVWFYSLDAARLGAVVVARATYRIPYFWSQVRLEERDGLVQYTSRRRWPGPRGASTRIVVEPGERRPAASLTDLDHFLTARWAAFSAPPSGLRHARAAHEPWPIHDARVVELDDHLLEAAGLPPPEGEPITQWSPGVEVRFGWPTRVGGDGAGPPLRSPR